MLSVNIRMKLAIVNMLKILMNVFRLSKGENSAGVIKPAKAIVKVNELT